MTNNAFGYLRHRWISIISTNRVIWNIDVNRFKSKHIINTFAKLKISSKHSSVWRSYLSWMLYIHYDKPFDRSRNISTCRVCYYLCSTNSILFPTYFLRSYCHKGNIKLTPTGRHLFRWWICRNFGTLQILT